MREPGSEFLDLAGHAVVEARADREQKSQSRRRSRVRVPCMPSMCSESSDVVSIEPIAHQRRHDGMRSACEATQLVDASAFGTPPPT